MHNGKLPVVGPCHFLRTLQRSRVFVGDGDLFVGVGCLPGPRLQVSFVSNYPPSLILAPLQLSTLARLPSHSHKSRCFPLALHSASGLNMRLQRNAAPRSDHRFESKVIQHWKRWREWEKDSWCWLRTGSREESKPASFKIFK